MHLIKVPSQIEQNDNISTKSTAKCVQSAAVNFNYTVFEKTSTFIFGHNLCEY